MRRPHSATVGLCLLIAASAFAEPTAEPTVRRGGDLGVDSARAPQEPENDGRLRAHAVGGLSEGRTLTWALADRRSSGAGQCVEMTAEGSSDSLPSSSAACSSSPQSSRWMNARESVLTTS